MTRKYFAFCAKSYNHSNQKSKTQKRTNGNKGVEYSLGMLKNKVAGEN